MSSGAAECGISTQEGATFAIAAGAKERSVMAILAHTATAIAVRDDGAITRPRQLDGKLYAGFGLPQEVPELQAVIRADGGNGRVPDRDARHLGVRGALRRQGRLHDHLQRLGGDRGARAQRQAPDLRVHRLRNARLVRRRPRLQR